MFTKIGIFDSGIGGFSLLVELARQLPDIEFIYYADSENAPYGEKTESEILSFTEKALDFLTAHGTAATVLACNTATAVAARPLRAKYPSLKIFGMEPAVNEAVKHIPSGKILATATPVTLKGEKYISLLDRTGAESRTLSLPLPRLVRLAEGELFRQRRAECPNAKSYIQESLCAVGVDPNELSALVLGCTHFVYFTDIFRSLIPDECRIFNGISGTAAHIINTLSLRAKDGVNNAESVMSRTSFYICGRRPSSDELLSIQNCISLLCKIKSTLP